MIINDRDYSLIPKDRFSFSLASLGYRCIYCDNKMKKYKVKTNLLDGSLHVNSYYICDTCRIYFKAKTQIIQKKRAIIPSL